MGYLLRSDHLINKKKCQHFLQVIYIFAYHWYSKNQVMFLCCFQNLHIILHVFFFQTNILKVCWLTGVKGFTMVGLCRHLIILL